MTKTRNSKVSKAAFVRKFSPDTPVSDILQAAKKAGLTLSPSHVYKERTALRKAMTPSFAAEQDRHDRELTAMGLQIHSEQVAQAASIVQRMHDEFGADFDHQPSTALRSQLSALTVVCDALRPLSAQESRRVLKAAGVMLGWPCEPVN
jgi:hypothetical protein